MIYFAAIVLLGGGIMWMTVGVTMAGVTRDRSPSTALKFWPDGFAMANKADLLFGPEMTREDLKLADQLTKAALQREPTSAKALRVKAFVEEAAGRKAEARRAILMGHSLSRRDLFTNLWLIEDAVKAGDIPRTLRHYDIALRTSGSAPALLFPVLDGALADPGLQKPISGLLSGQQPWVPGFVEYVVTEGKQQAPLTRALLAAPASLKPLPDSLKAALLFKLVDLKQFALAWQLYERLGSSPAKGGLIRDPQFEQSSHWPPFDWSMTVSPDLGANISRRDKTLSFFAAANNGGIVARQLIAVPPGQYRFGTAGFFQSDAARGQARWEIICAGANQAPLMRADIRKGNRLFPVQAQFSVPQGCPWQWVQLLADSADDQAALDGVVGHVSLAHN